MNQKKKKDIYNVEIVKFHASLSNCDAIYECPAAGLAVQPQPA